MTTVLVVDDAAMDRRLAGKLLANDDTIRVEYAIHGIEALARMDQSEPDLVVTDMMMPEMDGLVLVAAIRIRHPLTPVILMTSLGSEEIAVRALHQGAASYVPKSALASDLLGTVHRVLDMSRHRRGQARLMECMAKSETTFLLENDKALIGPLVGYLQDTVTQLGLCDESERVRVGMALEEAMTNALYHGNLECDSTLREEDSLRYYALADQRRRQSPYSERRIQIDIRLSRSDATFTIHDEGPGFDPANLPDPTDPANLEKLSGRGVLLMRTFMDEVVYNAAGNAVTMVKRRRM